VVAVPTSPDDARDAAKLDIMPLAVMPEKDSDV